MFKFTQRIGLVYQRSTFITSSNRNTYQLSRSRLSYCSTSTQKSESSVEPVDLQFNVISAKNESTPVDGNKNVIILHGLFGAGSNWRSIAPKIANETNCNIYQVDQRNHGSSPHTKEFSLLSMVEDLHRLVTKNKIDKLSIIGHSMGGKVAMLYSLLYPYKVDKLIVVDISPTSLTESSIKDFKYYLKSMKEMDLKSIKVRSEAEKNFIPEEKNKIIRSFLMTNLTFDDPYYRWRINVDGILENIEELAKFPVSDEFKYYGDTLFVAGGNSSYVRDRDHPIIKKYFPNAIIETLPNIGHWVHAENPALFTKIASSFLKHSSPKSINEA